MLLLSTIHNAGRAHVSVGSQRQLSGKTAQIPETTPQPGGPTGTVLLHCAAFAQCVYMSSWNTVACESSVFITVYTCSITANTSMRFMRMLLPSVLPLHHMMVILIFVVGIHCIVHYRWCWRCSRPISRRSCSRWWCGRSAPPLCASPLLLLLLCKYMQCSANVNFSDSDGLFCIKFIVRIVEEWASAKEILVKYARTHKLLMQCWLVPVAQRKERMFSECKLWLLT